MGSESLPLSGGRSAGAASTKGIQGLTLESAGAIVLRYGIVFLLLLIGAQKWTRAEAEGIRPWIQHSPFLSWMYRVMDVQGASIAIGVTELTVAVLMAARRFSPRAAFAGSLLACGTFLTTLSFLVTTPGMDANAQGFLIKDIILFGASLWSAGEALRAMQEQRR